MNLTSQNRDCKSGEERNGGSKSEERENGNKVRGKEKKKIINT